MHSLPLSRPEAAELRPAGPQSMPELSPAACPDPSAAVEVASISGLVSMDTEGPGRAFVNPHCWVGFCRACSSDPREIALTPCDPVSCGAAGLASMCFNWSSRHAHLLPHPDRCSMW